MSKYRVGMRISEKLKVSTEENRKEGTIQYVFNTRGLIYRPDNSEDIFIHIHERDIKIIE